MAEIFNFSTFREKKTFIEVLATQKLIKDKMTGRVYIPWRIFKKIAKTDKIEGPKVFRVIYKKRCFSVPVTSFLTFLQFSTNMSI